MATLPCMCAGLRRASRAITQRYEQAMRPFGLRAGQLTILQVLSRVGELSQGQLGQILAHDSTTLTRSLAIMRREGWIEERRGKDRRERMLRVSKAGEKLLRRATPVWESVQAGVRREIGNDAWNSLMQLTHQLTTAVTNQGD